jgi:hypothetical protein
VTLRDNNSVVTGSGSVLSSAVLMQDRVHFEVEVLKPGPICVGVATVTVDLGRPLAYQNGSWALAAAESTVTFGDEEKAALDEPLKLAMSDILVRRSAPSTRERVGVHARAPDDARPRSVRRGVSTTRKRVRWAFTTTGAR